MWVFTSASNSSKVQKSNRPLLIIRARLASDLAHLRKEYMPQLSETTVFKEGYYPFYATIGHKDFVWGIARMRQDTQSAKNKDGTDERGATKKDRNKQESSARF